MYMCGTEERGGYFGTHVGWDALLQTGNMPLRFYKC